eukprot:COSAG01_NODE_51820_length_351_cov_1.833333_1_plen_41_part_10
MNLKTPAGFIAAMDIKFETHDRCAEVEMFPNYRGLPAIIQP